MTFKTKLITAKFLQEKSKVRIPVEKGDLGLTIDDPIKAFQKQILSGSKTWEEMSQQIEALVIFNKNKHPDIANKWARKREALDKWVEKKRKNNPDFGK